MAAPHVSGSVALMMSGLRAQNLSWSPFSIKRALENSANRLENQCPFGQGNGLLNIEGAFEHLTKFANAPERDVRFAIGCNGGSKKGVYLRGSQAEKVSEIPVSVEPFFLDADNRPAKVGFNTKKKYYINCKLID